MSNRKSAGITQTSWLHASDEDIGNGFINNSDPRQVLGRKKLVFQLKIKQYFELQPAEGLLSEDGCQ